MSHASYSGENIISTIYLLRFLRFSSHNNGLWDHNFVTIFFSLTTLKLVCSWWSQYSLAEGVLPWKCAFYESLGLYCMQTVKTGNPGYLLHLLDGHLNPCHAKLDATSAFSSQPSGPSCSKLTTSLVNDSLKFTSSDTQICCNFLLKKCE